MVKRAEQRVLELFPVDMQMCIDSTGEPHESDVNEHRRKYVAYGYEQAEKDLALTWEDVQAIIHIFFSVSRDEQFHGTEPQYFCEEVLRRFNAQKEPK